MSKKPFDYSKWDNIELSDDEEDCHPNIDKESWFRMKHRTRVEREDHEEKEKAKIKEEMEKSKQRLKILEHDLKKINAEREGDTDDDDDDEDLDDREGLLAEIDEIKKQNAERQQKLDDYEKHKKWNVDNMFHVKEERTVVNPKADFSYTETGYVKPKDEDLLPKKKDSAPAAAPPTKPSPQPTNTTSTTVVTNTTTPQTKTTSAKSTSSSAKLVKISNPPPTAKVDVGAMETYHQFTEKYADVVEQFMALPDLESSKQFLLHNADILLQENASNYLLLASLEDEMNGLREKMKRTSRQAQIVSNITELAKTMRTHPGNVILPFFSRLDQRQYLEEFLVGVKSFQEKIIQRAITKKAEMDAQQQQQQDQHQANEEEEEDGPRALADIPREERLGPGGLDPLEVLETLPQSMVDAFESRDVEKLKQALLQLEPEEAQNHMDRCIAAGLWVANAS